MQQTLTTPRLSLRPLAADDGPELARVFAGAEVRRYLFDNEEVSPETLSAIVDESLRQSLNGLGLWLIGKDDGPIGCIGLLVPRLRPSRFFLHAKTRSKRQLR